MAKIGSGVVSWGTLATFGALLLIASPPPTERRAPSPMTSINPLIGDVSFFAAYGRWPSADDDDELRVRTHLAYVEGRLRAIDDANLPGPLRAARRRNLDLLRAYWSAGVFPAGEAPAGRQPTFIDDDGRRCAVAALVEASAGAETVARINGRYRNGYIQQMRDGGLAAWIAGSGFTPEEVALIQPNYSGPRPRDVERWQVAADLDGFYAFRLTGPRDDDLRHLPGVKAGLRLFDLEYAWLVGARAAIGHSFDGGGVYYDADMHLGYVAVSEGPTSLVFTAGGGVNGLSGVVPFAVTVPFGLVWAVETSSSRTVPDHPAISTVMPVLQLRAEGKWAAAGAHRAEELTWTVAVDSVWPWRRDYREKLYFKDVIVGVFVTRFAGEVYGGLAFGLGAQANTSQRVRSSSELEERYRNVLASPYE